MVSCTTTGSKQSESPSEKDAPNGLYGEAVAGRSKNVANRPRAKMCFHGLYLYRHCRREDSQGAKG